MANIDKSFGLKPIRYTDGRSYDGAVRPYYIASTYATALFIGDPVIKVAGGSNTAAVKDGSLVYEIGTLPSIEKAAAASGSITGVIVGFLPDEDVSDSTNHNPASTERVALVADSPNLEFLIQSDDNSIGAADIGLNAQLIFANSGDTITGKSGVELDGSTKATTQGHQLKILRVCDDPDNQDLSAANPNLVVKINQHTEADNTAGI